MSWSLHCRSPKLAEFGIHVCREVRANSSLRDVISGAEKERVGGTELSLPSSLKNGFSAWVDDKMSLLRLYSQPSVSNFVCTAVMKSVKVIAMIVALEARYQSRIRWSLRPSTTACTCLRSGDLLVEKVELRSRRPKSLNGLLGVGFFPQ